ncbi:toll/interleukin-1 receptor domain-containing protein [Citrobacter freundii]|uniref:toll/interleukin-1 receptor domain-containing protein n=1 Tax=Citrobacter sp. RHBSTW-00821 TaxID=2742663 RepID=UPI0015E99B1B|nr:toll/interleukin-1 receptor domain-containing protein [Citrobacter sp. RHBSTW-00821]QLT57154.1 toll/interleukin-1 receptor domain-containing protein [Citrobacter sp. RHBSTW-00821]
MEKNFSDIIIDEIYKGIVQENYPEKILMWPLINGFNIRVGSLLGKYQILIYKNTGNSAFKTSNGIGELSKDIFNGCFYPNGSLDFKKAISIVEQVFDVKEKDAVFIVETITDGDQSFVKNGSYIDEQINMILKKHEMALNMIPLQIFLSHKTIDKPKVREFHKVLKTLGFDPWLDEDKMSAGVELERALIKGMKDSCAAVFFITPSYKDDSYLSAEINYAISEKRKRPDFSIIALVYEEVGSKGVVPDLLTPYVWKEPKNDLEAMRYLLDALPVKVGSIELKK